MSWRARVMGMAALALLASCGKSDTTPEPDGTGGITGSAGAGGTGGVAGTGGTGGIAGNAGAGGTGGVAGTGGTGGIAGSAGAGGTGGVAGTGGNGGIAGSAGAGGSAGVAGGGGSPDCTGTQPSTMVTLPDGYGIDSTEVTRCQYHVWLATTPSTSGQDSWCSWNTDFAPQAGCMAESPVCQGGGCGKHPQVCVDWCDAYAYCKAMGRRLCGKRGGGSNDFADVADASKSQWYNACVSDGTNNTYPYGSTYDGQKCNGYDKTKSGTECGGGSCRTVEVGSLSECQSTVSGYGGVYDLSGNVIEWEDSCNGTAGSSDHCHVRGGSFGSNADFLQCGHDTWIGRNGSLVSVGFRCCAP